MDCVPPQSSSVTSGPEAAAQGSSLERETLGRPLHVWCPGQSHNQYGDPPLKVGTLMPAWALTCPAYGGVLAHAEEDTMACDPLLSQLEAWWCQGTPALCTVGSTLQRNDCLVFVRVCASKNQGKRDRGCVLLRLGHTASTGPWSMQNN